MNLSANLKRLRRCADLTQEQLAEILGVSFQSISKWERNDGMPDITLLPSIARFFNTTVDNLLNMDEEQQRKESEELDEILLNTDTTKEDSIFSDIALLREHVKKYPLDWEKQIRLSWYIFSCECEFNPLEDARINRMETVEILQRVVNYCDDMYLKAKATDFLVCALSLIKPDGYPEIKEKMNNLINSLPPARYSREMIALQANKKNKKYTVAAAKAHIEVLKELFLGMEQYDSEDDKILVNEANAALKSLMDSYN